MCLCAILTVLRRHPAPYREVWNDRFSLHYPVSEQDISLPDNFNAAVWRVPSPPRVARTGVAVCSGGSPTRCGRGGTCNGRLHVFRIPEQPAVLPGGTDRLVGHARR